MKKYCTLAIEQDPALNPDQYFNETLRHHGKTWFTTKRFYYRLDFS
ncbi:MAG: hypothetical protein GY754_08665 [bacterium]|nr:hypothetical protein [bacterium]